MPVWMCNNELPKDSEVIIFDLDGVISDAAHRQHFLKGTEKDWDGFFSACTEDPPIISGVKLINVLNKHHKTIILTARPKSVQSETVHWLKRHSVVWDDRKLPRMRCGEQRIKGSRALRRVQK